MHISYLLSLHLSNLQGFKLRPLYLFVPLFLGLFIKVWMINNILLKIKAKLQKPDLSTGICKAVITLGGCDSPTLQVRTLHTRLC